MKVKAKLHMKDGSTSYRQVVYIKPYFNLEVDGKMVIFEPRHFEKIGKEVILNIREYIPRKRYPVPHINT